MHSFLRLVSIGPTSGPLLYPFSGIKMGTEEDEYIEAFGSKYDHSILSSLTSPACSIRTYFVDSNETSGIWQEVRDIASDEQKMKTLSKEAHEQMNSGFQNKITRVKLETKLLTFHNMNGTKARLPILADTVIYGVEEMPESTWFFTKGTKPDCVFFLMPQWEKSVIIFRLGRQTCGVHVPK